jgi:hypothetical protein
VRPYLKEKKKKRKPLAQGMLTWRWCAWQGEATEKAPSQLSYID